MEVKERVEKLRESLPEGTKCSKCGKEIKTESPDEYPKTINNKPLCDDCWFKEVGEEIEKHPIMSPRMLTNYSHRTKRLK